MTTPRGDDDRHADDETRVDIPVSRDPNESVEHRPPAFPSVGGTAAGADGAPKHQSSADSAPPFEPAVDHPPLLPAFATADGPTGSVTTAPVGGRTSRWRWVAALVATLVVVAMIGGFFVFLGPRPGIPSLVAQYAPADAAVYVELRLDLPGDQRDRLVSFMSNFPGFADPSTFQQKIDQTLQEVLQTTGTGLDWKADVDPWFGGQIGLFSSTLAPSYGTPPSVSVVLSVKDRTRLDELVDARFTGAEEYKGQTIWSGTATEDSQRLSFAVTDEALVVSARTEDLKRALDVKAGEVDGLAEDPFFTAQLARLHSDRLAAFYYDYSSVFESIPTGSALIPKNCMDDPRAAANIRVLGEVRAESDHLAVNMRSEIPSGGNIPPAAANKLSTLAESMPADAIAYLELRQAGALIKSGAEQLLTCMAPALGGLDMSQLDQLLGTAPQEYFDFVDDAAIAVTSTGGKYGAGLIAAVDDENVARVRVDRLLGMVRLAGGLGGGVTIEEEQHGDAMITVIKLGAGLFPQGETRSIAVTVTGGRLYLGVDDFVTAAIDRAAADSLASAPRLRAALAAAGNENAGVVYLNIAALRGVIEGMAPAESRTQYDSEFKPWIEPITHLILVNRTEGGINVGHAFLYVE